MLGKDRSLRTTAAVSPPQLSNTQFFQLPIGGGGFCTGVSVSNDGKTVLCKNDSGLAFKWNFSTLNWDTLTNKLRLPVGYQTISQDLGCYAIEVAPSNSSIIYMLHDGWLFRSTNAGLTFTQLSGFSTAATGGNNQLPNGTCFCNAGSSRLFDHKLAIDPINPDICIVGTGVNGCFITKNGTQANPTFTQLSFANTGPVYGVPPGPVIKKLTGGGGALGPDADFTIVTTAATTNSNVITYSGSNPGFDLGDFVYDQTSFTIPANVTVTSVTATTINLSQAIPSIPIGHTIAGNNAVNATRQYAGYCICFDPSTAAQSGGATQIIYIASYFNPIYKSTDGGTTWAPLNSGTFPTTCQSIAVGPDQTLWIASDVADNSGSLNNVWSCATNGTWTQRTTANIPQVNNASNLALAAGDSSSAYRIIVFGSSTEGFAYTTNNFQTNGSVFAANDSLVSVSADATWLNTHTKPTTAQIVIDPSQTNLVWVTCGLGMYQCSVPASPSTVVAYTGIVSGIENLSPEQCLSGPGPGTRKVWVTVLDQGVFKIDPLGALATNNTRLYGSGVQSILPAFGLDYATTDSSFYCVSATAPEGGFSTDGGQTYQLFATQNGGLGGCIACTQPSDMVQITSVAGDAGLPRVTNDGGNTWHTPLSAPAAIVSIATTATTTSSPVLQFANSSSVVAHSLAIDQTNPSSIPTDTHVLSIDKVNNTVTLTNSVTVASGDTIQFSSGAGYNSSEFNRCQVVCADKNASGTLTFYILYGGTTKTDPNMGVWRSTDRGNTWTQVCSNYPIQNIPTLPQANLTTKNRITSWPGEPYGTLLIHGGTAVNGISISTDAGVTWSNLNTQMTNVVDYGYGAARSGSTHTTLYVIGTYGGVPAFYKSHDRGATFVAFSADQFTPLGILSSLGNITGDMNVYGRCYFNASGAGWFYTTYISGP